MVSLKGKSSWSFLLSIGILALCSLIVGSPAAQTYPSRTVRIVVGFAPGGTQDIIARLIGQRLSEQLGQQFIIENRQGAVGNIAAESVVRATGDGYTLLLVGQPNAVNATLYDKLNFNFVNDIAPIASVTRVSMVILVNPSFPAKTVSEFVTYTKANPGKVGMASAGSGTPSHITGELFKMMAGVDMRHIPYRGAAPAFVDLLGGQVEVFFASIPEAVEHVKAGKLRPLAVTIATRSEALPDVPIAGDFVRGFEASSWYGVGAPKNTPIDIVDRLNREINTAVGDPKLKARLAELGGTVLAGSPGDFANLIATETEKWGKVIRAANIKAQ